MWTSCCGCVVAAGAAWVLRIANLGTAMEAVKSRRDRENPSRRAGHFVPCRDRSPSELGRALSDVVARTGGLRRPLEHGIERRPSSILNARSTSSAADMGVDGGSLPSGWYPTFFVCSGPFERCSLSFEERNS